MWVAAFSWRKGPLEVRCTMGYFALMETIQVKCSGAARGRALT